MSADESETTLTPRASTYRDLTNLPQPKGRIVASVYNFKDQSGQYRPSPASSFSTAVTQGATAMLVSVLSDSGWFIPLEREGLQDLLTERKIIRAALKKNNTPKNNDEQLPSLLAANVLLEGGIIAYDSNIRTGGLGARYFGLGVSGQYRLDQVTVNLRAVDIRTGQVLSSVMTSKTILSQEVQSGLFRFIEYKRLLELEGGMTTNEPAQLCVLSAIESAVIHLISDGLKKNLWQLRDLDAMDHPVLKKYRQTHAPAQLTSANP
ncbi:curli production assembly/transport protein CsgG [bacterium endosymbiont of Escarpia laminata]|nr:MAG: curli production assembly/transport protein CsgG [bacterium endosymbiont of Escarpia laminata]